MMETVNEPTSGQLCFTAILAIFSFLFLCYSIGVLPPFSETKKQPLEKGDPQETIAQQEYAKEIAYLRTTAYQGLPIERREKAKQRLIELGEWKE